MLCTEMYWMMISNNNNTDNFIYVLQADLFLIGA